MASKMESFIQHPNWKRMVDKYRGPPTCVNIYGVFPLKTILSIQTIHVCISGRSMFGVWSEPARRGKGFGLVPSKLTHLM